jgi:hypothetical protein
LRSILVKEHFQQHTAAYEEHKGMASMTTAKHIPFENHLSNAETEATIMILATTEQLTDYQKAVIDNITLNHQKQFEI